MTDFLVRKFIKNPEQVEDEKVRSAYGVLAGILGIICNVILCAAKIGIGVFSGLAAVVADGINNLSDAVSSVVELVGVKLAQKPADAKHPFGHGRFEYVTALIVTFLILEVAINCFKSSLDKIIHPETIHFSHVTAVVLFLSVGVKIYLCLMNRKLGRRINSKVLLATAKDALGDIFITAATIVSLLLYMFFKINIDGYVGCGVAIVIFISGIRLAKDTIDPLLGEAVDEDLYRKITAFVESYAGIEGTHDLIVHSYGPTRKMATIHAELKNTMSMEEAHNIVDRIENDIRQSLKIFLVIHMDPVDVDHEDAINCKKELRTLLEGLDPEASLHDLRMLRTDEETRLIFDLVVPFSYTAEQKEKLTEELRKGAKRLDERYECIITVENSYVARHEETK